jgi:hypothetical protein
MSAIAKCDKIKKVYMCEPCDYITCNLFDFTKHINTKKHSQSGLSMAIDDFSIASDKKSQKKEFICTSCNKVYKDNSGLWKHKKRCEVSKDILSHNETTISSQITPELVLSVLEQNKELTNLVLEQNKTIMELAKNGQGQTINSNNVNSNNKTFNLNVFLNEYCKDAMNITDFVDSLKLQVSDLENMGKVGFVEGITNIIVKNLQALDIYKRPVHCADKKREVIYIKDEDKWEKETDEKNKMRKVIKKVADKNQRLLPKYREAHPGCNYAESKYSDIYNKIVIEALGGMGDNDAEKEDKIIRNIAKEVVIDKKIEYN